MMKERDDSNRLTDQQLLFLIRHFKKDPFEMLLERYNPLIRKVLRDFYVQGYEEEDLWQEARMVFHRIVYYYEEGKGFTLGNYYKVALQNHLYSLIRKDMTDKRKIERQSASLDNMADNGLHFSIEYAVAENGAPFERLMLDERLEGFADKLSPLEKEVLSYHLKEMPLEEIALQLNYSEEKVRNALVRSKRKMKDHLER